MLITWISGVIVCVFYIGMVCAERKAVVHDAMKLIAISLIWPLLLVHLAGWCYKKIQHEKR